MRLRQGRVRHHSGTGPPGLGGLGISWKPSAVREVSLHITFCHLQQVNRRHGSASRGGWGTRAVGARTYHSRNRPGAVVPPTAPFLLLCLRSDVSPFFFFFYDDLIAW